jgi:hypothetical protein
MYSQYPFRQSYAITTGLAMVSTTDSLSKKTQIRVLLMAGPYKRILFPYLLSDTNKLALGAKS